MGCVFSFALHVQQPNLNGFIFQFPAPSLASPLLLCCLCCLSFRLSCSSLCTVILPTTSSCIAICSYSSGSPAVLGLSFGQHHRSRVAHVSSSWASSIFGPCPKNGCFSSYPLSKSLVSFLSEVNPGKTSPPAIFHVPPWAYIGHHVSQLLHIFCMSSFNLVIMGMVSTLVCSDTRGTMHTSYMTLKY